MTKTKKSNTKQTVLKFVPAEGHAVSAHDPGSYLIQGQAKQYVGYLFDPKNSQYVVSDKPFEVDEGSALAKRLVKLCRRDQSLIPFDQHTATICGVAFTAAHFDDETWK